MSDVEEIIFNTEINQLIQTYIEIFKFEYDEISEKDWNDYKNKPRCGSCRKKILDVFRQDEEKFNNIISKLRGKETIVYFPGPINESIVKEFNDLKEMEAFLTDLKKRGKMIRSATPSPNGKGGFVLVVL